MTVVGSNPVVSLIRYSQQRIWGVCLKAKSITNNDYMAVGWHFQDHCNALCSLKLVAHREAARSKATGMYVLQVKCSQQWGSIGSCNITALLVAVYVEPKLLVLASRAVHALSRCLCRVSGSPLMVNVLVISAMHVYSSSNDTVTVRVTPARTGHMWVMCQWLVIVFCCCLEYNYA